MNRTSTTFAAVLGTLGIIGTSFAASASAFVDVSASHMNAEAIVYVKDFGIVNGYPDNTYKPDHTINRAEFTKIIVEARHELSEINDMLARIRLTAMADVESGSWYERYVNAARAFGLVSGYPDGTFKPAASINFAEAAKILAETYSLPLPQGSVWYEGYVRALIGRNAVPMSINNVGDAITRGEMAEMIYRLETGTTTKPSPSYDQLTGSQQESARFIGPGCKVGGCSGQLCVGENSDDVISTCEYREEYACYQTARCERQNDGECGWTPTPALSSCLADKGVPTNACAAVLCPVNTRCDDGKCIPLSSSDSSASAAVYTEYSADVIGNGQQSVLFFYAAWCPVCRGGDEDLRTWYDAGLPNLPTYKVNYDTETALKNKYGVTYQHTFVLIDGEGNAIQTLQNPGDAELKALIGA